MLSCTMGWTNLTAQQLMLQIACSQLVLMVSLPTRDVL